MSERGTEPAILVVEDDPAHSEAMARVLSAQPSYRLRFAASIAEAQREIAREVPALVLADLNLADGKAFDLLSSSHDRPVLPVLVLTSHGDEQTAVRAMRSGALDYVVKSPEAFAGLTHTVERALREWRLIESRRAAEAALRESEERFRVLFESSPDACYIVTAEGNFIDINRAAEEMLGYSRADVVGKTAIDLSLIHPDYMPAAVQMAVDCHAGVPSRPTELVCFHRSGREIVVESRAVPVRFRDMFGILSTSRDISERKRAEAEQRRLGCADRARAFGFGSGRVGPDHQPRCHGAARA